MNEALADLIEAAKAQFLAGFAIGGSGLPCPKDACEAFRRGHCDAAKHARKDVESYADELVHGLTCKR